MQAQKTNTLQIINANQSLAAVQTLLKAGIGCITYLRNLLPVDHFDESYFTSTSDDSLSFQSTGGQDESLHRNVSSGSTFKIMTIMRGLSNEADRLLSHLEDGIFDALEKRYLRAFILGIHLDSKDPHNVVETYTFKFQYHTVHGTNQTYPVMTLGLDALSLNDNADTSSDPVTRAIASGKAPTVLDVKKSVKAMLKRLIQATTHMDSLPERRYASFKVFYYDHTPDDYEPPTFQSGDVEKDKWYFTTHNKSEVPEKWGLGDVKSGFHSVSINITSVTSFLPNSTCDNDAVFTGTTTHHQKYSAISSNPIQQAKQRQELAERQAKDAEDRKVAWSADNEGIPLEPENAGRKDISSAIDGSSYCTVPLGVRNGDGVIEPFAEPQTPVYEGVLPNVPRNVREIPTSDKLNGNTQVLESPRTRATQPGRDPSLPSVLPPSDFTQSSLGRSQSLISDRMSIDIMQHAHKDAEMLDMETQPTNDDSEPSAETIESFTTPTRDQGAEDIETTPQRAKRVDMMDNGLQCECEINIEVDALFCEGGCGFWYHVWCMGYHSIHDQRLPEAFKCFNCRLQDDMMWELIKQTDMYSRMIDAFKELALFRRAIKVAEKHTVDTLTAFAKVMGCSTVMARALFKKLEAEGFITSQVTEIDGFGLASRGEHAKSNSVKRAKPRRNLQKNRYIFVRSMTTSSKYAEYFNPDQDVEGKLIGIPEMRAQLVQARRAAAAVEKAPRQNSFTQAESQALRRGGEFEEAEQERPIKKAKISLTFAIDLAE